MNVRTLLIIAGLALPVIAFAILSQSAPQSPKTETLTTQKLLKESNTGVPKDTPTPVSIDAGSVPKGVKPGPMSTPPVVLPKLKEQQQPSSPQAMTLQQAIEKVKKRLSYLEKMNPADWPAERTRHLNAPRTLAQAKDYNRNRLATLATMTEAQWNREQQEALHRQLVGHGKPVLPPLEKK